MEFFKKRKNAIGVFVAVVIIFSLLGCHRSLSKACRGVEDAFFDKGILSTDTYYTCPGDQLQNCLNYTNRLLSVINGSDELTDAYATLSGSRLALANALDSRDISDIYEANTALVSAVDAVDALVQAGASLPESNDDYETIVSDFYASQNVAASSPYNGVVEEFIRTTVRPFPTNILRVASFVALPETYS